MSDIFSWLGSFVVTHLSAEFPDIIPVSDNDSDGCLYVSSLPCHFYDTMLSVVRACVR